MSLKETQGDFSEELKIAAAVKFYEMGKLSSGKAARLAGMDKNSFWRDQTKQYKLSPK